MPPWTAPACASGRTMCRPASSSSSSRRWGSMLGYQPKELSARFDIWREHHPGRERVLQAFFDHLEGKSPFIRVMHRMIARTADHLGAGPRPGGGQRCQGNPSG